MTKRVNTRTTIAPVNQGAYCVPGSFYGISVGPFQLRSDFQGRCHHRLHIRKPIGENEWLPRGAQVGRQCGRELDPDGLAAKPVFLLLYALLG